MHHFTIWGIHQSPNKIFNTIRQHFYRPYLRNEITNLKSACFFCQTNSSNRRRKHPFHKTYTPETPREAYAVDLGGGFPVTKNGHPTFMIILDLFSFYIQIIPMKSRRSQDLIDALKNHILTPFGPFKMLVSDQEPGLRSTAMCTFLEQFGAQHRPTSRYDPNPNGTAELYIGKVKFLLRCYINENHDINWDQMTFAFSISLNKSALDTANSNLYVTPELLQFGFQSPGPLEMIRFEKVPSDRAEYLRTMKRRMTQLHDQWSTHKSISRETRIRAANKTRKTRTFTLGQLVYARTKPIASSSGLHARFEGPYFVRDLTNCTALLEHEQHGTFEKVSFSHMLPATLIEPHQHQTDFPDRAYNLLV